MTWMGVATLASCVSLVPIRCRGALHFYSGRDVRTDRLRVVVMAPRIPVDQARARLTNLARLHRLVAGPRVPAVAEEAIDAPTPWVALDCDAIADHEQAIDWVVQGGDKPPFRIGAALGKQIMETLEACHRVRDPETGGPVCLGSLAPANLLFSAEGRLSIVGFGGGRLHDSFFAPEVAGGAPATPGADAFATMMFMRAQMDFAVVPPAIERVFAGQPLESDAALMQLLMWSNAQILAAPPAERAGMDAALQHAKEMWRLLEVEPDVAGFEAYIAHALAIDSERLDDAPTRTPPGIRLGPDAEWLETPNGMRHALGARRSLRRMLLALAEARRDHAGTTLSVDDLLEAGWPGEDPLVEAGSNRVYVAISTLRKLGLGELLQRWDGGYRLDPVVPFQF
jgi:hypothetical protein